MSTPTDEFAHLTLESQSIESPMAPPDLVRERARSMQDILSSYELEDVLPSEYQSAIFNNVYANPYGKRLGKGDWKIAGNLVGTLLQLGAYDEGFWEVLSTLQTPERCAIAFHQKLKHRFDDCIEQYDTIESDPPTALPLKDKVFANVDSLKRISRALSIDRGWRQKETLPLAVEYQTLAVALQALEAVCSRTQAIIPSSTETARRTTRRTTSLTSSNLSLFALLIKEEDPESEPFLLDALEQFSGEVLATCLDDLIRINGPLTKNGAPIAYIKRFDDLQTKARDAPTTAVEPPTRLSGHESGLDTLPKPGSKRHQPAVEATPKRGKRTGGK